MALILQDYPFTVSRFEVFHRARVPPGGGGWRWTANLRTRLFFTKVLIACWVFEDVLMAYGDRRCAVANDLTKNLKPSTADHFTK